MSSMKILELARTTTPLRLSLSSNIKASYPPVLPPWKVILPLNWGAKNHPRPISTSGCFPQHSYEGWCARSTAADKGDGINPRLACMNLRRSFAVDRTPPAPANVGKFQFGVGLPFLL